VPARQIKITSDDIKADVCLCLNNTGLANLSFGFVAVDGGAGYTYLDPTSGREFSVVGGLTYNFMNQALQYKNGIRRRRRVQLRRRRLEAEPGSLRGCTRLDAGAMRLRQH
jgi:outer membrane putative beta-barrel porin/alpha-amylase